MIRKLILLPALLWLLIVSSVRAANLLPLLDPNGDVVNETVGSNLLTLVPGAAAKNLGLTGFSAVGSSTVFPTVEGPTQAGNPAVWSSDGGLVDAGPFPAGGGGGGTGTVNPGVANTLSYYPAAGSTVSGLTTGTGVLTALGNPINGANGLVQLNSSGKLTAGMLPGTYAAAGQNSDILGLTGLNSQFTMNVGVVPLPPPGTGGIIPPAPPSFAFTTTGYAHDMPGVYQVFKLTGAANESMTGGTVPGQSGSKTYNLFRTQLSVSGNYNGSELKSNSNVVSVGSDLPLTSNLKGDLVGISAATTSKWNNGSQTLYAFNGAVSCYGTDEPAPNTGHCHTRVIMGNEQDMYNSAYLASDDATWTKYDARYGNVPTIEFHFANNLPPQLKTNQSVVLENITLGPGATVPNNSALTDRWHVIDILKDTTVTPPVNGKTLIIEGPPDTIPAGGSFGAPMTGAVIGHVGQLTGFHAILEDGNTDATHPNNLSHQGGLTASYMASGGWFFGFAFARTNNGGPIDNDGAVLVGTNKWTTKYFASFDQNIFTGSIMNFAGYTVTSTDWPVHIRPPAPGDAGHGPTKTGTDEVVGTLEIYGHVKNADLLNPIPENLTVPDYRAPDNTVAPPIIEGYPVDVKPNVPVRLSSDMDAPGVNGCPPDRVDMCMAGMLGNKRLEFLIAAGSPLKTQYCVGGILLYGSSTSTSGAPPIIRLTQDGLGAKAPTAAVAGIPGFPGQTPPQPMIAPIAATPGNILNVPTTSPAFEDIVLDFILFEKALQNQTARFLIVTGWQMSLIREPQTAAQATAGQPGTLNIFPGPASSIVDNYSLGAVAYPGVDVDAVNSGISLKVQPPDFSPALNNAWNAVACARAIRGP